MAPSSPCQSEEPNCRVFDVEEVPTYDRCAHAPSTPPTLRPPACYTGEAPLCRRPERQHRRRFVCVLETSIIGAILVFDSTTDRLVSALRQSQGEVLMIVLVVLAYLTSVVRARRLSSCTGTAGRFRDETPGSRARKVAEGPTKYVAKIALPPKRQCEQWNADRRLIQATRKDSMPSDTSTFSTLVDACIRLRDADKALDLFDHMLKTGIAFDQQSVTRHTSSTFFKVVASKLDDKRMQKDGIQLLRALQAHGLEPTSLIQNQLICSWKSKLPEHVVEAFVNLRKKGVHLSATACRCVMAAHERSEPAFTLRLYDEMVERGLRIDRVAFNAALCACSHLGMTEKALELFEHMPAYGLAPNGKTYGALIRACTSSNRVEQALHFFESMRAAGFEPNCFALRDAIQCCADLGKLEKANELYNDMIRISRAPCDSTYTYILEACQKSGCLWIADRIADAKRSEEQKLGMKKEAS